MTRKEFAEVIVFMTAAIGKSLGADALKVYYDLLGDLPIDVLRLAAKKVVLNHPWATFPGAAELRQASADVVAGLVTRMSPAQAWEHAWGAAKAIDLEVAHTLKYLERLPPLVKKAVLAFGLPALCYGKEPVGVVRGQFLKIYEQLDRADAQEKLLPAPLVKAIQDRPEELQKITANLGRIK